MRNPNPWITASSPLFAGAIALLTCTTVSFAANPMGAFYSDEFRDRRWHAPGGAHVETRRQGCEGWRAV